MSGFAASLPSLSDFVANLEATKWFKRPVEILDSQVQSDPKAGDLVKFSIKGALNDPEAPPPVPAAAGRGAGRRREALTVETGSVGGRAWSSGSLKAEPDGHR